MTLSVVDTWMTEAHLLSDDQLGEALELVEDSFDDQEPGTLKFSECRRRLEELRDETEERDAAR